MFIFGGLLITLTIGILFLSTQLQKRRMKVFSVSFVSILILTVIIPGTIATYFLYGFSCMDGCYVKKYTPKWFFTMNLSEVGYLPIIQPKSEVNYYYDTDLGKAWEVTYESKSPLNEIKQKIESYLTEKNVKLNIKSSCSNGHWDITKETVIINGKSKNRCIIIYLDDNETSVLVRALEM